MRLSTDFAVRFARGRAWIRPWCEVNHRPLDWASRSLSREFEVVIMVERAIGEMVGSDRVRPIDYMRTLVNDEGFFNQSATEQLSESTPSCAQKSLDNAVIVRDGRKVALSEKFKVVVAEIPVSVNFSPTFGNNKHQ